MEELEIKSELNQDSDVSAVQNLPEPENTVLIDEDAGPVKKKPKMEIELDFGLVKNEYYKPRERRPVQRYKDTLPEINKKVYEVKRKKVNDADMELFCEPCNQYFTEIRFLKIHNRTKHSSVTIFTCALCSATFKTNVELMKHKLVHNDENRNFLCMKCKTAFSDHLEYLKHMAKHQKSPNYFCIECGQEFDYTCYMLHIGKHYYKMVECDVCNKKFNMYRLKDHMKIHDESNKISCVECGKKYTKHRMSYHMISHTGVKPYQCLYCGKGFSNQGQRNIHTRTHTGEKPYACKVCQRRFAQYTDMSRHMEGHEKVETKMKCEVCNKVFKHKLSFKYHMDIHNNTQRYSCHVCGFKVNTNTGLRSHLIRAHTKDKVYECVPCGVAFKTSSDLHKHKKKLKHINNQYGYNKKTGKEGLDEST